MKKIFAVFIMVLFAGMTVAVDMAEAKRRASRSVSRPATSSSVNLAKPTTNSVTNPTAATSGSSTATSTGSRFGATAPSSNNVQNTTAPAASAAPAATSQTNSLPAQAAPAPQTGSGMGGALLGAGAGLAGGYLLGQALAPEAAQAGTVQGLDYKAYCKQTAKGDAQAEKDCLAREEQALATLRQCSSQIKDSVGSYATLLECFKKLDVPTTLPAPAPAK